MVPHRMGEGVVYACARCGGRAATLRALRLRTTVAACDGLRAMARRVDAPPSVLLCPSCGRGMVLADARHVGVERTADACPRCDLVWFARGEISRLPMPGARRAGATPTPTRAPESTFVPHAVVGTPGGAESDPPRVLHATPSPFLDPPPARLEDVPIWLGGPVELEPVRRATRPWATRAIVLAMALGFACSARSAADVDMASLAAGRHGWLNAVANLLAWLFSWRLSDFATSELAVSVLDPWRGGGAALVTAFFAHASPWALLTVGFWFFVLADDVEALLGRGKFLALVFGASAAGFLAAAADRPLDGAALYGACGGVAAVVGCYATLLPHVRLGFFGRRADPILHVPAAAAPVGFALAVAVLALTGAHEARRAELVTGTLIGLVAGLLEGRTRAGRDAGATTR